MTVLKSKRSVSKMEFFQNAITLRKYVTFKVLRDFGIKRKVWNKTFLIESGNLSDQDRATLNELLERCDHVGAIEEYPQWYISTERANVLQILHDLIRHITYANTIYINSEAEATERRNYQNCAIADCEYLLQEFGYIMDVIPEICANKLIPLVEMTNHEIALLKAWRKSDNKRLQAIKRSFTASSTAFCNANNNGNAGYNNATNVNGVRPDFIPESVVY